MRGFASAIALAASLALSACQSTRVASLAPNIVRLNLQGADAPSDEDALKVLLELAAKETLARGYTHFRFMEWQAGPPQTVGPGERASANFSVSVVMFRDGEQGQNPVFDARQVPQTQTQR